MRRYNWRLVQRGALPLRPNGELDAAEQRCTSALLWPQGEDPTPANTVLVDPCFTDEGYDEAVEALAALDIGFADVGRIFVTHLHTGHMLHLPYDAPCPHFRSFRPGKDAAFDGLCAINCPGHHPLLLTLSFTDGDGRRVWIVGDAILDADWLRAWRHAWPPDYTPEDVVETWRSQARILAEADVIVPGHAPAFEVTPDLLRDLLDAFPQARYAADCPDVADALRARLAALDGQAAFAANGARQAGR